MHLKARRQGTWKHDVETAYVPRQGSIKNDIYVNHIIPRRHVSLDLFQHLDRCQVWRVGRQRLDMSVQYRAPHCQKRPKLLIQIQSDMETFGHSIDFDLKVRRASKQAIEFAIPFWKRVTDHHEFRAKLCDYFRERMASNWYQEERSTLQNTILVLVKTRTFREAACAHFSEKRGAVAALEVLRRIDTEWVCGV